MAATSLASDPRTANRLPTYHVSTTMNRSLSTRRCAAAATMVIGLGLVAGPLAIGALSRAAAGERLIVGGRAAVGKDAIVQLRSDTNVVIGGLGQLTTDVLPAVSSSLNLDDARFKELLRTRYPAISAGVADGEGG